MSKYTARLLRVKRLRTQKPTTLAQPGEADQVTECLVFLESDCSDFAQASDAEVMPGQPSSPRQKRGHRSAVRDGWRSKKK